MKLAVVLELPVMLLKVLTPKSWVYVSYILMHSRVKEFEFSILILQEPNVGCNAVFKMF